MNPAEMLPLAVVIVATCFAAVTDIRTFKIYHAVTLPLLLSGFFFRFLLGGWVGLGDSLTGAFFGFASLLIFYLLGGMGAGDVKLMAGVGAWLGMPLTFHVFLAASLAAGVYAVVLVVLNHGVSETVVYFQLSWLRLMSLRRRLGTDSRIEDEVKRDDRSRRLIPFAAMILVGIFAALIWEHVGRVVTEFERRPRPTLTLLAKLRWIVKLQTVLILVVALALGGAAVWLIAPAVMSRGATADGENVTVVTAAVDIARGATIIESGMTRIEAVPKRWANPNAISKLDDAVGRVVMIPILAGEPVLSTKITEKGAGVGLAAIIPKGMRAFTIQTPTVAAGVAGFVLPGNKVDVLLTVKEVGGIEGRGGTIILLQHLEILAVDQRVGPEPTAVEKISGATKELRSVTLLVTPEQAAKLDLAQNLGTLHLTLRNPDDTAEVSSLHLATIAELSDIHPGLFAPVPKPPAPSVPVPKRVKPPEEIRTIRGNQEGMVQSVPLICSRHTRIRRIKSERL